MKMAKTKEEYQNEAVNLGIDLEKDGKELTVEELKAEIKEKSPASNEGKKKKKKVKVRFLKSPAGQFMLPYNVGQEVSIDPEQAKELIDQKYAEKV